ncbi:MAG: ferrous iron transporter B, partial [Legionella sp.]
MTHVLLVGNPNCGKTTLFNALTGDNQRIGNWPGVTVEKKTGQIPLAQGCIEITDLPGVYSLISNMDGLSQDEQIATHSIANLAADCIINVVDACHLERHLYLTSQILELGKPVVLALNMMDVAESRGISIDIKKLSELLGCAVIPLQAHKNLGVKELLAQLQNLPKVNPPIELPLNESVRATLNSIENQLIAAGYQANFAYYASLRLAEGDSYLVDPILLKTMTLELENEPGLDIFLADARYNKIHQIVSGSQKKRSDASENFTAKLDRIFLHRFLALPIFFG